MPNKNGFEVLSEMKADPQLRKIPVIMLTSRTADEDVVRSYEDGASTYIAKTIQPTDLRDIFQRFGSYWAGTARLPPTS
jgi:CheY-like chemotaxis protein